MGKKQESNDKSEKYKCLQMFSVSSNSCIKQWKHKIRCTFIIHYKWKDIDFPIGLKDCKTFETNSKIVYLNNLFSSYNKEEIKPAYISKSSSKCENRIILLITDGEKFHYFAKKSLSRSLQKMRVINTTLIASTH